MISSSTIYYLLLYGVIFAIRYFKLKKEFKFQDPSIPEPIKINPKQVFFVSIDILYSAAGFVIILINNNKDWTPVILLAYALLVLVSSNLSSLEDRFGDTQKLTIHISIIAIVILATFFTFYTVENKNRACQNDKIQIDSIYHYRIAIPYVDKSLINHLGYDKVGDKKFIYYTDVNSINENIGIEQAISNFWKDTLISPLIVKKNDLKKQLLKIDKDFIIAKLIK